MPYTVCFFYRQKYYISMNEAVWGKILKITLTYWSSIILLPFYIHA